MASVMSSSIILLVLISASVTSGARTQLHFRVGDSGIMFGEKFLITLSDVIYWIAGICLGFIFAVTYVLLLNYDSLKQEKARLRLKQEEGASTNVVSGPINILTNEIANSTAPTGPRDSEGRLIGSKKYPTQVEERILTAIHTEPDNYIDTPSERQNRTGRLIGMRRAPTSMEYRVLKRVDQDPDNAFGN